MHDLSPLNLGLFTYEGCYKLILWFWWGCSSILKVPKIAKKKLEMSLIFLEWSKHQSFLQVDFNTLGIKVSYMVILSLLLGMNKHFQHTQSNKFAISLQYLKKEVRNGVHFLHADKHQSFYKLGLLFLMEVASYVQRTQNRKLVIVSQVFYGGPVMFFLSCFLAQPDCRNFLPEHWNIIIKQ